MEAQNPATWVPIGSLAVSLIALGVAIYLAVAPALNTHQRRLRGELRVALRDVAEACMLPSVAERRAPAVMELRKVLPALRMIQEEGLLSPSRRRQSELEAETANLLKAIKSTMPVVPADDTASDRRRINWDDAHDIEEFAELLKTALGGTGDSPTSDELEAQLAAQARKVRILAETYIKATVRMDNGNFVQYYRLRWQKHPSRQSPGK